MKIILRDKALLRPHGIVKERSGIIMPDTLYSPTQISTVISASDGADRWGCEVEEGDIVVSPTDMGYQINDLYFSRLKINGEDLILASIINLVGKVKNKMKTKFIDGATFLDIDWENDIQALGPKIFVEIYKPKDNASGLIMSQPEMARDVRRGKIVSLGKMANSRFHTEEVKEGDVVTVPSLSGSSGHKIGESQSGNEIHQMNGWDVILVERNGEWAPVGGNLLTQPIVSGMKEETVDLKDITGTRSRRQKVYTHEAFPNLVIPQTSTIPSTISRVISSGGGPSEKDALYSPQGIYGPLDVNPGDVIIHRNTKDPNNNNVINAQFVKIGLEEYYLIPAYHVLGVTSIEESVDQMAPREYQKPTLTMSDFKGE